MKKLEDYSACEYLKVNDYKSLIPSKIKWKLDLEWWKSK